MKDKDFFMKKILTAFFLSIPILSLAQTSINTPWIWVNGSKLTNQSAVYGIMGIASVSNTPGNRSNGCTKWIQKINSANYIDYAQPLIATKISKVPFSPRRIIESLAGSILDKSEKLFSFLELYDDLVVKFSNEIKK